MWIVAEMEHTRVVSVDSAMVIAAADLSLEHGLATADAFVYAAARMNGCGLVTSDADFRGLPGVTLIEGRRGREPCAGGVRLPRIVPTSLPAGCVQSGYRAVAPAA